MKKMMTNENLIDLACKWLENHQSNYIEYKKNKDSTTPIPYVSGDSLTNLRAFLNYALTVPESKYIGNELFYHDIIEDYKKFAKEFYHTNIEA